MTVDVDGGAIEVEVTRIVLERIDIVVDAVMLVVVVV